MSTKTRKPGQIPPQSNTRERTRKRAEQAAAAAEWQARTRERRALEETFLKYDGTEVANPKVGPRGSREIIPAIVYAGDELLAAEKAEAEARQVFLDSCR